MTPLAPNADEGNGRQSHPFRSALLLSGTYVVLGSLYIAVSDQIAAQLAQNEAELERISMIKGWAFVFSTGLGLLIFAWLLLKRIQVREQAVAEQRHALLEFERQTIASVFAASVAHDINNILVVLQSIISELRKTGAIEQLRHHDPAMLEKVYEDLRLLTRRLTTSGEQMPGEHKQIRVADAIDDAIDLASTHASLQYCQCEVTSRAEALLEVNGLHLRHAMLNLLINAGDASHGQGRIEVRSYWAGPRIVIEVHDEGPGVSPMEREKIFDSFYTTKEHGTGLGLLTVKSFAAMNDGDVEVTDSPLGGACFRMTLAGGEPASDASETETSATNVA